ncbi:extracellular solute-binding protein [Jannaschia sp. W003]|uniref:extracellular solute-binding protein n=1 Tax=Jannaschia sp. W003 TaxID=2867012 RepID=UPI0021A60ACF|nr:extracellular solute-binding protein [Jannaschia sp. W003]UWQ20242.1 extracellular solute-binding protein [Jannaschia sp. W003]
MPSRTLLAALAATVAAPALAGEVNVYSYRQPELIAPLVEGFEAASGHDVNIVYIDQGITERLVAEGRRSPADLVFTVDIARLTEAKEAGVTQAVESDAIAANVPEAMRDPEGHWAGVSVRARAVYASKERVADGEVTTYEDLADPKWRGRICTRPGTHDYNIALISAMIEHHGPDETRTWLEGLKANLAKAPEGNDRAQVKSIWAGECDISLGNTYYMGAMLGDPEQQPWADSVRLVFPTFGEDGGTHVNVSGVAMTQGAPNRDVALEFMEYLTSPEAQEIYAEVVNEYPVAPGAAPSELVAGWGDFTPDATNLVDIAAHRAEALKLVEEVDYDAGPAS